MKLKTQQQFEFPTNLWSIVFERDVSPSDLPPDWEPTLFYILDTLYPSRKRDILLAFYRDGAKLGEIGVTYDICRERVRQILTETVLTLRHPTRRWILLYGLEASSHISGVLADDTPAPTLFQPPGAPSPQSPISELDLSARALHYLTGAGICTVEDLTCRTESSLLCIPNFGLASLRNVKAALQQYGYVLTKDVSDAVPVKTAALLPEDPGPLLPHDEISALRTMVMDLTAENTRLSSLLSETEGERDRALLEVRHLQKTIAETSLPNDAIPAPTMSSQNLTEDLLARGT